VIPVLNENIELEIFAKEFSNHTISDNWSCEKIIVDGGSNDGSVETLEKFNSFSLLKIDKIENQGRFTAIRKGVLNSRGRFVLVFHSDREYPLSNLQRILEACTSNPEAIIVGSRTIKGYGAAGLKNVYSDNILLYWISRLGGSFLAGFLTLRLGRPISDPFCGIIAGDRDRLISLIPMHGDIDAQVKILLACRAREIQIIEVALDFSPRSRTMGKKTNYLMGIKALAVALSYRARGEKHGHQ
jgi:glycosyltransferase involved in cell wall biosynthesis